MTSPPRPPDPARKLQPGEPRYHSLWRTPMPGAYFDAATADAAVAFLPEYCRLTTDQWAGQPFVLAPWQAEWIIRPAFGWKRADGTRLYRRVIIWLPRKNGKTELMAGVAHLCLLGDGLRGAEMYSLAASGDQASIVFNAASQMVAYSDALAEHYEVFEGSLFVRATHSRFEPLTGKPHGKHGLKAAYLIGDEVHEWKSDRLYTFVRQSMASRLEPLEFLISSAGVDEGYGVGLWRESIGICEGTFDDPETLAVAWCAPQDSRAEIDIEDPHVWAEANPNYPTTPSHDYMVRASREANQSAKGSNDFKCYHLGVWIGQSERWLEMTKWNACASPGANRWKEFEDDLAGRECWGGLDLASTQDFNALLWKFPPRRCGEKTMLLCRFWYPRVPMQLAAKTSRVPFDQWHADGAFMTTPGNAADHQAIIDQVHADCGKFKVMGLGVDLFNAHSVLTSLHGDGVRASSVRFAMLSMAGPTKALERAVLNEEYDHGGQPVLRWMAANTAIRRDQNGNYMPCKASSSGKIDGIAALVVAEAMHGAKAAESNVYGGYMAGADMMFI